jgi:hypothetical protein
VNRLQQRGQPKALLDRLVQGSGTQPLRELEHVRSPRLIASVEGVAITLLESG